MDFVPQVSLSQGRFSGLKIKKHKIHFADISLAAQNKLCQFLEHITENKFYHVEWKKH